MPRLFCNRLSYYPAPAHGFESMLNGVYVSGRAATGARCVRIETTIDADSLYSDHFDSKNAAVHMRGHGLNLLKSECGKDDKDPFRTEEIKRRSLKPQKIDSLWLQGSAFYPCCGGKTGYAYDPWKEIDNDKQHGAAGAADLNYDSPTPTRS
jgi:hypothetical protein